MVEKSREFKRSDYLMFHLSLDEKDALKRLSLKEGRTMAEMLRELVREAAAQRNLWPPKTRITPCPPS